MTPFYTRFPELAARETRCAHVVTPGGPLPLGEYGFIEFYCEDPGCDCRRVVLQVTTPQDPRTSLATINYGWERVEFYAEWMHGDAKAGREIVTATLDPLHSQSKYAQHLLEIFRNELKSDPEYVARLARHYEMFKREQRSPSEHSLAVPPSPLEHSPSAPMPKPAPPLARPKVGRNDPCPCGSGKKHKKCCGMN